MGLKDFFQTILRKPEPKDSVDISDTRSEHQSENAFEFPVRMYIPDSYEQDSEKSVVNEKGLYDYCNFSEHEAFIIESVLRNAYKKYPKEIRSLGLANECECMKYKARDILFDSLIVLFEESDSPVDQFAVAIAYKSKGAYFRKHAIRFFEKSVDSITPEFMSHFLYCSPSAVYSGFSKVYESEHDYEKAIELIRLVQNQGSLDGEWCAKRVSLLEEKLSKPSVTRTSKIPESRIQMEKEIRQSAIFFISKIESNNYRK